MTDYFPIQDLAFKNASRTFAYICLAQGLTKAVTGFSSIVKHCRDSCLAVNVCTHFMDDIPARVGDFDEMIPALRGIFDRELGLKLSAHKCQHGTTKVDYISSTITPKKEIQPKVKKLKKSATLKSRTH